MSICSEVMTQLLLDKDHDSSEYRVAFPRWHKSK